MNDSNILPVIIVGAGGHAKVVAEALKLSGRKILGFTDPVESKVEVMGFKVLGNDDILLEVSPNDVELANGIGALPGETLRWKIAEKMNDKGYKFTQVIHPRAIVSSEVKLSEGVQIMAGAILQPGVCIGSHSIVNTGALIDHDCVIGEKCHIAPGVIISGGVIVSEEVHIATGASVIQGLKIGKNTVIAAGGCVYKDVGDGALYKG